MKIKMKKNYIAGVAKLLGVEEGEVFQVNDDGTLEKCFFKFTDGFLYISDNGKDNSWCVANDSILIRLLYGYLSICKPLWKPTLGEKYYTPTIDCKDLPFLYTSVFWADDRIDKEFYKRGLVFKTKEEAVAMAETLLAVVKEERKNGTNN